MQKCEILKKYLYQGQTIDKVSNNNNNAFKQNCQRETESKQFPLHLELSMVEMSKNWVLGFCLCERKQTQSLRFPIAFKLHLNSTLSTQAVINPDLKCTQTATNCTQYLVTLLKYIWPPSTALLELTIAALDLKTTRIGSLDSN